MVQVDERRPTETGPTHLHESFAEHAPLRSSSPRHARGVVDLDAAAKRYALTLKRLPARRPCSTLPTWDSDLTDTPLPWCLETLC